MEFNLKQMVEGKRGEKHKFSWKSRRGMKGELIFKEVEHTLTTGGLNSTITALIPDGALLVFYSLRVLTAITTGGDRTTINFGQTAGGVQFGTKALTAQALAKDTTVTLKDGSSLTALPLYTADQDFVINVSGGTTGNITAGSVVVVIGYFITTTPAQN